MTAPMQPNNPSELFTPFLTSTYNIPQEEDRLNVFLVDQLSIHSDVINQKKIGTIVQAAENFNGETWWYLTTKVTRNGYQALAYIPSYPNTGTLTLTRDTDPQYPIPNINPQFVITHVYGSASKPCTATGAGDGDYFSFMAEGDSRISFTMSDTTIIITTTTDLTAYSGFIVVNYLRNGV